MRTSCILAFLENNFLICLLKSNSVAQMVERVNHLGVPNLVLHYQWVGRPQDVKTEAAQFEISWLLSKHKLYICSLLRPSWDNSGDVIRGSCWVSPHLRCRTDCWACGSPSDCTDTVNSFPAATRHTLIFRPDFIHWSFSVSDTFFSAQLLFTLSFFPLCLQLLCTPCQSHPVF